MYPNQLTTDWIRWNELRPYLEMGDLVEFNRSVGRGKHRIYAHWAVVVANLSNTIYVAHLSLGDDDFKIADNKNPFVCLTSKIFNANKAEIRRDELSLVARGDLCRINNSMDARNCPFPPEIIVERANVELGAGGYNLLFNNCEHFAKYCRYGIRESKQAVILESVFFASLGLLVASSVPVALVAGCTPYAVQHIRTLLEKKQA
uniref:LRAT domain-containing protein n=1 Tax=Syphacia muris TaxID=451379 RepID=A0A0N5ASD7_9BILA